jgi:hypothetical protein
MPPISRAKKTSLRSAHIRLLKRLKSEFDKCFLLPRPAYADLRRLSPNDRHVVWLCGRD